ncbi:hypothetical protein [Pseudoalteromonas denitrificans]|uniref:Uncharacterized protein n=1 Tax=Pseudoalteromonas denitrificans DSM 6059 TaxID=1123010 RepID=A0A1I1V0Q4_9GAMM|nr:hypothetical protein [Pseudoalteromonas denitrificans]SFD76469.1 hypothetical protein SAMN02745724_05391 [Pseudoalteromonas denitrificans DSM 6059]
MFNDEIPLLVFTLMLVLIAFYCMYWSVFKIIKTSRFIRNESDISDGKVYRENKSSQNCITKVKFIDQQKNKLDTELKYWSGFSVTHFKENEISVRYRKVQPKLAYINQFKGAFALYSAVLSLSICLFFSAFFMVKDTDSFYIQYVELIERLNAKPDWQYTSDKTPFELFPEMAAVATLPEWVTDIYAPMNISDYSQMLDYIYSHPKAENEYQRNYLQAKNAKVIYYFMLHNKGNEFEVISGLFRFPYYLHDNFVKDAVLLMEFGLERYKNYLYPEPNQHVKSRDTYAHLVTKAYRVYMQDKRYSDAIRLLDQYYKVNKGLISDEIAAEIEWGIAFNYWKLAEHDKAIILTAKVATDWPRTNAGNIASRNLVQFKKQRAKPKKL